MTTDTVGADGIGFTVTVTGLEVAEHPSSLVYVTVYTPGVETTMLCVVAPLLHKFLVLTLDVNVTLPPAQNGMGPLTVITGGCGTIFGRDVPLPAVRLVHPFTVCVTVYVALLVTVMAVVVAPLLHNTEPVTLFAVNTELPQLLTTATVGAEG